MYEKLKKQKLKKGSWFYYLGNKPILNSFILDYRIRNFDYYQSGYSKVHLGEWISLAYNFPLDFDEAALEAELAEFEEFQGDNMAEGGGDSLISDSIVTELTTSENVIPESDTTVLITNFEKIYASTFFNHKYIQNFIHPQIKDRIIFVGDFEDRDFHETIYGNIQGPIILLDAVLALEAGDNVIHLFFIMFLLSAYILISYTTFNYDSLYAQILQKLTRRKDVSFFESLTFYIIYFAVVSVTSFFLFNMHVGVLILAFYINFIEKIKLFIQKRREKKRLLETI